MAEILPMGRESIRRIGKVKPYSKTKTMTYFLTEPFNIYILLFCVNVYFCKRKSIIC